MLGNNRDSVILKLVRSNSCVFGDAREHSRTYFLMVMKSKSEVWPTGS